MPKNRVAIYFTDERPIREILHHVKYAEEKGFEAVWQGDTRLSRDPIVPIAAYAAITDRIKVGTGVMNMWTRNVATIAATFSTLDEMAPGRAICGLGAWWEPIASRVGVDRRKPLKAMREMVTVLRKLLAMEKVTFEGEFVRVHDIELDIVYGERRPRAVPIYIGATGLQMVELTGEIADGIVMNYLVPPHYNLQVIEHLKAGAARSGRDWQQIDRPQLVVCSMDRNRQKALEAARRLVTQYLAFEPHIMKASGAPQYLLDQVHSVLKWPATEADVVKAMKLVPDDFVQSIAAAGTPDECLAKVREYMDNGCTCPILYQLTDDVKLMIDAFSADF
jgi:5,10-methylenetetrahydromethanopterin reductase